VTRHGKAEHENPGGDVRSEVPDVLVKADRGEKPPPLAVPGQDAIETDLDK